MASTLSSHVAVPAASPPFTEHSNNTNQHAHYPDNGINTTPNPTLPPMLSLVPSSDRDPSLVTREEEWPSTSLRSATATDATPTTTTGTHAFNSITNEGGAGNSTSNPLSNDSFPVFRNQVAGHSALLWHKGTVCKPLNPTEYFFYSNLLYHELSGLIQFVPKFYGILDMNLIPSEFQKQQAEKDHRKAEKLLVKEQRERREYEARKAQLMTAAAKGDEQAAAELASLQIQFNNKDSFSSTSTNSSSYAPHGTALLSPSNSNSTPIVVASSTATTENFSPTNSTVSSNANTVSSPTSSDFLSPSAAGRPYSHSNQHLNTWVFQCQNRKKKYGSVGVGSDGMLAPTPTSASADQIATPEERQTSALSSSMKAQTLPASFSLATAMEQHQANLFHDEEGHASGSTSTPAVASTPSIQLPPPYPHSESVPAPTPASAMPSTEPLPQYIVLEDLTFAYTRPCILDLKLGTRQHGIHDSAKKIASKIEKCRKTTSGKLGIRLCGMQVFHPARKNANGNLPAASGMMPIQETEASQTVSTPNDSGSVSPSEGRFIYYDKYYGRSLNEESFLKTLKLFFWNGEKLLLHVILLFLERLDRLRQTLEQREMNKYRFYSSSLLMVYEGLAEDNQRPASADNTKPQAAGSSPPTHALLSGSSAPRPAHYPTLNSLNSSVRLHDIHDRSLGMSSGGSMSRSQSMDFHPTERSIHHNEPLSAGAKPTDDSNDTGSSPPAISSSSSTPHPVSHLDADDVVELQQILKQEQERINEIRRNYNKIVDQKIGEEQVEQAKLQRKMEEARSTANSESFANYSNSFGSSATGAIASLSGHPASLSNNAFSTSTPSSTSDSLSTPLGAISPSAHISYVNVNQSGASERMDPFSVQASPQPPSPLPIPAAGELKDSSPESVMLRNVSPLAPLPPPHPVAALTNNSNTSSSGAGSAVNLHPAPPLHPCHSAPSASSLAAVPKFYNRARKTTHAQARERARLKGNIDIRLIDYAQVVKWEGSEERSIVDPLEPTSPTSASRQPLSPGVGSGFGDPGLLIGVNNLIYFISNIVQQEIQQMLLAEKMRSEGIPTPNLAPSSTPGMAAPIARSVSAIGSPSLPGAAPSASIDIPLRALSLTPPLSADRVAINVSQSPLSTIQSSHTAAFASSHVPRKQPLFNASSSNSVSNSTTSTPNVNQTPNDGREA